MEDRNNRFSTLSMLLSLLSTNSDVWNNSVQNITGLFYDSCNITSCNPVHYNHCYDDKVVQLVIHAIVILLGIVSAFFGNCGYVYAARGPQLFRITSMALGITWIQSCGPLGTLLL